MLSVILLTALPSLFLGEALWTLPPGRVAIVATLCASYVACIAALVWREPSERGISISSFVRILSFCYAPAFLLMLLMKIDFPRRPLLLVLAASFMLACAAVLLRRFQTSRLYVFLAVAVMGLTLQTAYATRLLPAPPNPGVTVRRFNSSLYALQLTEYVYGFQRPKAQGGGISRVGDRYLLATGDGDLYLVAERNRDSALTVQHLPVRVPANIAEFMADVGDRLDTTLFRTADILAEERHGKIRMFVSHHYWNAADQCFVLRVSELEDTLENLSNARQGMPWKTVFESSPCVSVIVPGQQPYFPGNEIGGRLLLLNDKELLVSIGANGLDGWNSPVSMPQDMSSSYGKTVLVNLEDLSSRIYSLGHRNPQGLTADASGAIWLTEHGPQGGDELNLIESGKNYGFPVVTYGVQYGTHAWPLAPVPGSHAGFTEPYYSWIPSVGISNLLVSDSPQFKLWKGDLLVTSLKAKAIFRIRIRDSRVVMVENLPIGERLRDIEQGHDGELLLWTDSGSLMFLRAATDTNTGQALFDICAGCHAIDNGKTHGIGPDLYRVVDRPVGSARGFQYSPALQTFGGQWTKERLDAFLTNPQAVAPGTTMQFNGLGEATSRAKLIEFLGSDTKRSLGETVVPD